MTRAADALDRGGDRFRRIDLADQIDRADVDTEFERRGRDDRLELAAFELLLGGQTFGAREAPMMGHHRIGAELFLQRERDALGPSAAQREDQRRAMLANECSRARRTSPPNADGSRASPARVRAR